MRAGPGHVPAHPGRRGEAISGSHAAARLDALERLAGPVVRAAGMDLEAVQFSRAGRRWLLFNGAGYGATAGWPASRCR